MASFQSWMQPHKRRWRRIVAGYQSLYNDSGNWSSGKVGQGQLIGTNRSIAAPTLIAWRGRMISKSEMMALSIEEAQLIYKVKYWDKIKGDSISSQLIADLLADMKSSAGGNAIKELQKVLNHHGENLAIDGAFGSASLAALNRQINRRGEITIYNAFRDAMEQYYKRINSPYERQLIGSLNRDYPRKKTFFTQSIIIVSLVAALVGAYSYYHYKKH